MWILFTLVSLLLILIILLCLPIDLVFRLNTTVSPMLVMQLEWLSGLIHRDLCQNKHEAIIRVQHDAARKGQKRFYSLNTLFQIIKVDGLLRQLWKLVKGIILSCRIRELAANLSIGLEDPVHYGYLYALTVPVNILLQRAPHQVVIQPFFEGQYIFDCSVRARVRIYPIRVLLIALLFVTSLPFLSVIKILVQSRWKTRN